jgi:hypothetical protein
MVTTTAGEADASEESARLCTRAPISITRMIRMPTMFVTTSKNESWLASVFSRTVTRRIVITPRVNRETNEERFQTHRVNEQAQPQQPGFQTEPPP